MEILKLSELKDYKKSNLKILVYGESFVGKTTFAATFEKPFIISTDGNIKALEQVNQDAQAVILSDEIERTLSNGQVIKESGWLTFKQLVDGLVKKDDIKTIVIDLIKDVYEIMRKYVMDGAGIIHESEDNRMGRIWAMYDSEFLPVIRKLMTADKNVILIAHEKDKDGKASPKMIDSIMHKIMSYSDITARIVSTSMPGEEPTRVLNMTPAIGFIAGNRLGLSETITNPTQNKLKELIEKGEK